ncbi:MAG: restriction endonuclease [Actinobacteria bacterium]|nr:restriction endonuclease [Actinomycetota bacterium]
MARLTYYVEIRNDYLGKYKRVTGRTRREVEFKVNEQLLKWAQEEERARERAAVADEKERAKQDTEAALACIEEHRRILEATLPIDDRIQWKDLLDRRPYPKPTPRLEDIVARVGVPKKRPLIEKLNPSLAAKRIEAEQAAHAEYERLMQAHAAAVRKHKNEQVARNAEVEKFKQNYEAGDAEAVESYVSLVLSNSVYPEGFSREFSAQYLPAERIVVVDIELPSPDVVPRIVECKYVASRRTTTEVLMKDRDFQQYYDGIVHQTILRTIHEVFEGDYQGNCEVVVASGWVDGIDPATGRTFRSCIASCQASREQFIDIELSRIEPEACFRQLRGTGATRLAGLKPVAPIRRIEREDPRFVEAREVLDDLESGRNLVTMDWQDFEMLVRDLFEKIFAGDGIEVRVTRASRDEGVDAVVINPDPLRGGKTIIQAKRYRKAVPVAAVRELYGAMMNERAGKGILVTTGHFGRGAHDFVKDKEITLIDGAGLLHYLQNHGHRVRIDPSEATEAVPYS